MTYDFLDITSTKQIEVSELVDAMKAGRLSVTMLTARCLELIERFNPALNAVVTVNRDALRQAAALEAALKQGYIGGRLFGVPCTVKDAFATRDIRTTLGSFLYGSLRAQNEATVVGRLKREDAIIIGKTNLPEFCLGSLTSNIRFGSTRNPWQYTRSAGGSSGGEAASVASSFSFLGVGSDQGGSVRQPASFCGVVGFKPSLGQIPTTGHLPCSLREFLAVGLLGRHVGDVRLLYEALRGPDGHDFVADIRPEHRDLAPETVPKLRIGFLPSTIFGPVSSVTEEMMRNVRAALVTYGARVGVVEPGALGDIDYEQVSEAIYRAFGKPELQSLVHGESKQVSESVRQALDKGNISVGEILEWRRVVDDLNRNLLGFFLSWDILICPTTPTAAISLDVDDYIIDGIKYRSRSTNRLVLPFNITGMPAISVPWNVGEDGLPYAVQIVGRKFEDNQVLGIASLIEALRPEGKNFPVPELHL